MPPTTLDSLVAATDFSRNPGVFIERASNGEQIVILKNSRPTAVIIDVETGRRLNDLDELVEDIRLLSVALVRMATDSGRRFELDDVLDELGIELDDDTDTDTDESE